MADEAKNPPIKKFRVGAVSANIWERQTDKGTFHNVSFERFYKDDDGNPKSSNSFGLEDFYSLELVAGMAKTFLTKQAVESQA